MKMKKVTVFTGIDGSGKTTQVQLLVDYFRKKGIKVKSVQQFAPDPLEKPFLRIAAPALKKLERSASNKTYFEQKNSNRGSFLKSLLRICNVARIVCRGVIHTRGGIISNRSQTIIFDRYFYDALIKVKWMYGISDRLEKALMKLVPQPFLLFYLDVPAEEAWNREKDGDTTLDQHRWKKQLYDEWFEKIGKKHKNFYRVDVEGDENKTHLEIISVLRKAMCGE